MEITSLPTESLYKFMAFAGLVIIFGASAYWYKFYTSIGIKLISLRADMDAHKIKNELWNDRVKRDAQEVKDFQQNITKQAVLSDELLAKVESVMHNEGEDLQIARQKLVEEKDLLSKALERNKIEYSRFDELVTSHEDSLVELRLNRIKIEEKLFLIQFESRQKKFLNIGFMLAITLGLWLAIYGFNKWFLMQGYIDQATIREALKK